MSDQPLNLWGLFCAQHGVVNALRVLYPDRARDNPELARALAQAEAGVEAIKTEMARLRAVEKESAS